MKLFEFDGENIVYKGNDLPSNSRHPYVTGWQLRFLGRPNEAGIAKFYIAQHLPGRSNE